MPTLEQTNSFFRVSCFMGLLLSCYALFVELKKEENYKYKAYCDVNEHISCTKEFFSKYEKDIGILNLITGEDSMLNQPNSIAGIVLYFSLLIMSFSHQKIIVKLQTACCFISNLLSVYLAYLLYFFLKDICVICVCIYAINAVNLILSISKLNLVRKMSETNSKKKESSKNK